MTTLAAPDRLPRLLDRRSLASELGVKLATAENLMRSLPKIQVGRRVYVVESDVLEHFKKEAKW